MKTNNKINFSLVFLFFAIFIFLNKLFPQNNAAKLCSTYDELYETIKKGTSASIEKTSYINEFSMIEKSTVTIDPIVTPDSGYKVTFKINELKKGKKKSSYDIGSVLGYMVSGCKGFEKNYKKFIGTYCILNAHSPEDAKNVAEDGISYSVDQKYVIDGDLVKIYEKYCKQNTIEQQPVKKPAVYLYPTKNINVRVKLEVNGNLTVTDPPYNTGWNVYVTPDGLIDNKYDYLFYEADLNKIFLPEEGWIVEFKSLEKWFDEYLPKLGLNAKESEQFKEYWLKNLKNSNYYEIKLLDNKFLEENMKLIITPKPQTLIRLNFYFKPLIEKRTIKNPEIIKPERDGFTVVEWGGINAGNIKTIP